MFSAGFHLSPYFARMSFRFKDNIVMVILPTFYLRRKSLCFAIFLQPKSFLFAQHGKLYMYKLHG